MYALSVERPSLVVHTLLNTEFILEKTVKCMELENPSTAVVALKKKKHPESLTERNPTYRVPPPSSRGFTPLLLRSLVDLITVAKPSGTAPP